MTTSANEVVLTGSAAQVRPVRYTPAGVAITEFRLRHESTQLEAGQRRKVSFEMPAVACGPLAERIAALGERAVLARGFLAARSFGSAQVVLHASSIEFV